MHGMLDVRIDFEHSHIRHSESLAMHNDDRNAENLPPQDPNTISRICLITSATAMTAAACIWAVGYLFTGGMAAAGMAAVGLFYLALGLMNWQPRIIHADETCKNSKEITSDRRTVRDLTSTEQKPHRKHPKPLVSASSSSMS